MTKIKKEFFLIEKKDCIHPKIYGQGRGIIYKITGIPFSWGGFKKKEDAIKAKEAVEIHHNHKFKIIKLEIK